ncbi:RNA-binding transcriptional accessory protein, partial [Clostridium saudiense]|nr:RNA-binding transcriptional accessory protein [Clostridium saudiense]
EIVKALEVSETLTEVEDIYRPFKQKKRTRAIIALEKGLKPLAEIILEGNFKGDVEEEASKYIDEEKKVLSSEDAINGALDIIAEMISDEASYRKWIRELTVREGKLETKGSSEESTPYEMYYEYSEDVSKIPPHRILAINRGEKEKILSVKINVNEENVLSYLENKILKKNDITD